MKKISLLFSNPTLLDPDVISAIVWLKMRTDEKLTANNRIVLIVEDYGFLMERLKSLFEEQGVETISATNIEEAKNALDADDITEVLTDGLRGQWPNVADLAGVLPVRLWSSNLDFAIEAQNRGIVFLEKNCSPVDLLKEPPKL